MAYYGAISAVERAELTLKYRSPWFQWSGWFFWTGSYGPASDYTPEIFSGSNYGFVRNIHSRTTSIPSLGMGNTDTMLSDPNGDSKNYNQLGYAHLETFLLSYDTTPVLQAYYTWSTPPSYFSTDSITWTFRLPPKIHTLFGDVPGKLCYSIVGDCDPDGDGIYDDVVLSWSMEGFYLWNTFKIFPTIAIFYYSGMQIDTYKDNSIRESIINATGDINFGVSNHYSFITNGSHLGKHNVVGTDANSIESSWFSQILLDSTSFTGLRLSFGAANLFRTFTGAIYPYLEYQFHFSQEIADRFYTIQGNGRVGEYDVKIVLKKPTIEGTVGGDFTVIF